jgi:hypothetical protein
MVLLHAHAVKRLHVHRHVQILVAASACGIAGAHAQLMVNAQDAPTTGTRPGAVAFPE